LFVAAACLVSPACRAAFAAAGAPDAQLLADGAGDTHWLARVYQDPGRTGPFLTDVYARSAGENRWHQLARLEGRTVQLTHRGSQLALLLEDGQWLLLSEETVVSGRPLPGGAAIRSLATAGDTLAALAHVGDDRAAPASSPASAPASTHASADTERLVLFLLTPRGWVEAGASEVGGALRDRGGPVASLAFVEGAALVAVREGPRTVAVYRQQGNRSAPPTVVETKAPVVEMKLLGGGPVPVLWTVEAGGAASLRWLTGAGVKTVPVELAAVEGEPPPSAAAAYAIERVRVASGRGLTLSERTFHPVTGAPAGDAAPLRLPGVSVAPRVWDWVQNLLPLLLLFTIIASIRRRRQMQETMLSAGELALAPFGRRLGAGAVDAAPVLVAAGLTYYWGKQEEAAGEPLFGIRSQTAVLASVVLYMLHTSVSEIASARTLGKLIFGLRVASLDGRRPSAGALLTRNLLRLIDLALGFFPLVLLLYSPLRQRAGDVAAGTLVVLNKQGDEPAADAPVEPAAGEAVAAKEKAAEPVEVGD
jgi:uncharacterized RDD family membrane protein YckC